MKVLVVHPACNFSVADVFNGLLKGLKLNGADVAALNLDDRLALYSASHVEHDGEFVRAFDPEAAVRLAAKSILSDLYTWWPDVIVIVSGFFIPPEIWGLLCRRPHHTVFWCTESPYEDDRQSSPARYADTVILNDPTSLKQYRDEVNPRTFYMPHSYDPDTHKPGPVVQGVASDFAFVGTGFQSRVEFFEKVDWTGIDAAFGGNWQLLDEASPLMPKLVHPVTECLDNAKAVEMYRSAKVTANLYRKEASVGGSADGWAMGPREVELAACGSFFLREPRPEGDALFPMLPTFETPVEFEDLLRWWIKHPDERQTAANAARQAVQDRTFQNTAASLLRLVDGYKKVPR